MISQLMGDATLSGFGTWLGTVVSIVSAIVAFKQASKAASMVKRLKNEQRRNYVEALNRGVVRLDEVIKPIILGGIPARGIKVSAIVIEAKSMCHGLLSSPSHQVISGVTDSIRNIDANLAQIEQLISTIKTGSMPIEALHDLQHGTQAETQFLLCACTNYLDNDATGES